MKTPFYLLLFFIAIVAASCSKTGAVGPQGPQGPVGAIGPQGPPGTNGTIIYSGTITPPATTGAVGDFYINTATGIFYGPKSATGWGTGISLVGAQGVAGTNGTNGTIIYSGNTAPSASIGVIGDFYIDLTAGIFYGPKTATGWGTGFSLKSTSSSVDVYVAGSSTVNGNPVTTYWKNGIATTLTGTGAVGITVNGANVYVAGNDANGFGTYWKNDIATTLYGIRWDNLAGTISTGHINSMASAIAVQGTDVYVAGISTSSPWAIPTYWKNGIAADTMFFNNFLTASPRFAQLNAIAVQGSDVYTAGADFNAPYLMKNKIVTALPGVSNSVASAKAIALNGADVFVAGYTEAIETRLTTVATYWKNGTEVTLPDSSMGSGAYAITVPGTDVYIAGYVIGSNGNRKGAYWKNGTFTAITDCAYATGIAVQGNDVYVAGNNLAGFAAYWKNGVEVQLTQGSNLSAASGIAVVLH